MNQDILLKGATLISKGEAKPCPKDILIQDGKIAEISDDIPKGKGELIECKNVLAVPAFVNAHLHLGETLFRGRVNGLDLEGYLKETERINRLNRHHADKMHNLASNLTLLQTIKSGTGTISAARGFSAVGLSGLRGRLGVPLMKSDKLKDIYTHFAEQFKNLRKTHQNNQRISVDLWVHSLNYIEEQDLELCASLKELYPDVLFTIHIAETKKQHAEIMEKFGQSEVQVLDHYGLLDKNCALVHCIWLEPQDFGLIKERDASVILCPVSNIQLKSGTPDIHSIREQEINYAIGTDGLATGDSASLLENAKFSMELFSKENIPAWEFFEAVTSRAAKSLGLLGEIGSIRKGLRADIVLFDMGLTQKPQKDIHRNLILSCPSASTLIVDGRIVMQDGAVRTLDEARILQEAKKFEFRT